MGQFLSSWSSQFQDRESLHFQKLNEAGGALSYEPSEEEKLLSELAAKTKEDQIKTKIQFEAKGSFGKKKYT